MPYCSPEKNCCELLLCQKKVYGEESENKIGIFTKFAQCAEVFLSHLNKLIQLGIGKEIHGWTWC
jgi:hypothetical protein